MPLKQAPRGALHARQVVALFVSANVAAYFDALRTAWGVDDHERGLLNPKVVYDRPPGAIPHDKYPAVAVASLRASDMRRKDHDGDWTQWDFTYEMRLFSWVNVDGENAPDGVPVFEAVQESRDMMCTALRSMLLDNPTLGGQPVYLDENTLTEEYSEVTKVKGDRYVAGSFVGFSLRVTEEMLRASGDNVAATVSVDARLLPVPVHPALA